MTHDNAVFEDDGFAATYDLFNRWSASDDFYLQLARESGGRVLDVGCGTGMLACRIAAEGCNVTGVDPAEPMLRVARSRVGAEKLTWVKSHGQTMELSARFDLVYMTGHAFQALLSDEAALALLRNVVRHLADNGRFAFETRNPAARAWLGWTPQETRTVVETPEFGRIEQFFEAAADSATGIVEITQHDRYLDGGEHRIGRNRIRFIDRAHVAELLSRAGLEATAWYGDWDLAPLTPASREIVAVARKLP